MISLRLHTIWPHFVTGTLGLLAVTPMVMPTSVRADEASPAAHQQPRAQDTPIIDTKVQDEAERPPGSMGTTPAKASTSSELFSCAKPLEDREEGYDAAREYEVTGCTSAYITCTTKCALVGSESYCTGWVDGQGMEKTRDGSCKAAKKDASSKAPRGCRTKHCKPCDCN